MSTPDKPDVPKHTGGRFHKGVSGNPGGKKRVVAPQPSQPAPQAASEQASQPQVAQPKSNGRNKDGTFAKGSTPNPAGRPKGSFNKTTMAVIGMINGEAEAITRKCIDLALAGDAVALRLVMERLVSPVRERPVNLTMPRISAASDLIAAAAALTDAAAQGAITPGEAASLSTLIGNTAKAVETLEFSERLARIEQQLATKGHP